MNPPLPKDLAGWQNVREGEVRRGDLIIHNTLDLRCYAVACVGKSIGADGNTTDSEWRVYRLLPVR
jgi:hypothetical protein